jgi:hypothetical protein
LSFIKPPPRRNRERRAATAQRAGKHANAIRHGGTQTGKAIAIQRRKMGLQVVGFEPHRERRVPPAEHGDVSKDFVRCA